MDTSISHSPGQTEALGEAWGRSLPSGLVIGLIGELGAGKTQLVKGLARGLGCRERVHSPTFALLNEYTSGRIPLFHLDLYRLETPAVIQAAGLDEYLCQPKGISVVEWVEHWLPLPWPAAALEAYTSLPTSVPDPLARKDVGAPSAAVALADRAWTAGLPSGRYRLVWIEVLSEFQRRISYENIGD